MWRRRLLTALLLVIAGVLLGGCGVPEDGWVGVGRMSDGSFRVYLRTCTQPLNGATLYWPDDPNGANSNEEVFAEWILESAQRGPVRADWPLLGQGEGEIAATRTLEKVPGPPKNMAVDAWTRDASASAGGPYLFTARDLDSLKRGQILIANDTRNENGPPNKTVSRAAFDALDCADFG